MSNYFRELTLNLQHAGFVVKPETDEGLLPVELDGQQPDGRLQTAGGFQRRSSGGPPYQVWRSIRYMGAVI